MTTFTSIILEAYETMNNDFTALVVFMLNGKVVSHEKLTGYADKFESFEAGFNHIFSEFNQKDFNEATFTGNKFKKEYINIQ